MNEGVKSRKRLIEPMDRISEVLFGLIMVLTITCSFSIGSVGRTQVQGMLIGAVGCNLAWGVIDAVMYWMGCFSEHGHGIVALRQLHASHQPEQAHRIIADEMPSLLASVISPAQFEEMSQRLKQMEVPERPRLSRDDWLAGLGVFLLVVGATLPVVLPFAFIHEAALAMRLSNAIAIVMLFLTGYAFGRYSGHHPWVMSMLMVVAGCGMVGLTIALGG